MTSEEERAYRKGYKAGKRKKAEKARKNREVEKAQAFADQVFLTALPSCISATGWKLHGKTVWSIEDRVELANAFAIAAFRQRLKAEDDGEEQASFGGIPSGLSKREYFAGLAMQGILANPDYEAPRRKKLEGMAEDARTAADALLAELERTS